MSDDPFAPYLDEIEAPPVVRERLAEIRRAFEFLSGTPIQSVFLSNRINDAAELKWDDAWGFTSNYWLRAKGFLHQSDVDISGYERSIKYLAIQYSGIVFNDEGAIELSADSGLHVEVRTADELDSELSAVGPNCKYLAEIINTLLKPNLRAEVV